MTGDARTKGTKPGDTPSKDGKAQDILKNVVRSRGRLGGTHSLGLLSPFPSLLAK